MNKHVSKKTLWQSLLSLTAAILLILLAVGSLNSGWKTTTVHLGNGVYQTTKSFQGGTPETKVYTGERDDEKRWTGKVTIKFSGSGQESYTEKATFLAGKRHGPCTYHYPDGREKLICFHKGQPVECKKAELVKTADLTAFHVLENDYPWFLFRLNALDFDDSYVEAYMDTLETIIDEFGDDPMEFDDYYSDALDSLTSTPYDSIIQFNDRSSSDQGSDELLNDEFRLAVLDRSRSAGKTTYETLSTTYPGYLSSIYDLEVSDEDFKEFCHVTDSIMDKDNDLYGPLGLEDPFFIDSVDTRLYRAIEYILSYEDTSSSSLKSMKNSILLYDRNNSKAVYRDVFSFIDQTAIDSTTQTAAFAVVFFLLMKYSMGDILYSSVWEAWQNNNGIVRAPTATTEFFGNNTSSSANLLGYVHKDGGASVSARGITWATFYNPTTNDHTESSGTGLGTFTITLNNLSAGTTYYARTYATNSAGTSYGNCVKFIAGSAVGIPDNDLLILDFAIYPNPVSAMATFNFGLNLSENMELSIINLKGQVVYHEDLGQLPQGENNINLDLSDLPDGMYSCQLTGNGILKGQSKLLIVH